MEEPANENNITNKEIAKSGCFFEIPDKWKYFPCIFHLSLKDKDKRMLRYS